MNATATEFETKDHFHASLNIEGANVSISAPSFDLLSSLIAKFKGTSYAPNVAKDPSTVTTVASHNAKQPKPSAGVSADEKAAVLGNDQSQQDKAQSAAPADKPSPATEQAAATETVTQDMVNKLTIALAKIDGGTDKAKSIFAELGVSRASEITAKCPDRLAEAHGKLTAALGGAQ